MLPLRSMRKCNAIETGEPRAFSAAFLTAARAAPVAVVVYAYGPHYAMVHALVGNKHERYAYRGNVRERTADVLAQFRGCRVGLLCAYRGPIDSKATAHEIAARFDGVLGTSTERTPALAIEAALDAPCKRRDLW